MKQAMIAFNVLRKTPQWLTPEELRSISSALQSDMDGDGCLATLTDDEQSVVFSCLVSGGSITLPATSAMKEALEKSIMPV